MTAIPRPRPCYLDGPGVERLGFIAGELRWRHREKKQLYTWDPLHGEIEVFSLRGKHIGAIHAVQGTHVKDAKPGRSIDV